jgi:glycosyltransferase involved in cell wall biosynthesis
LPSPSVSIVVPAYNAAAHIEGCVGGITHQDCTDFELLVVDDGSTDDTRHVLARLGAGDPRMRVITHEDGGNHGVAATRNRALSFARGEYVWFVDADDRLRPGAIGRLLAAARDHTADVVAFNALETGAGLPDQPVFRQAKAGGVVTGEAWLSQCVRQKESRHYVWQRFYRRDYLRDIGIVFCEGIVHEDIAWITESDLRAPRVHYLDALLYDYVRTPGSLTRTDSDTGLLHRAESLVEVVRQLQDINRRCAMQPATRKLLQAELVGQGVQVDYLRRRLQDDTLRESLVIKLAKLNFWRSVWPDAVTWTRKRQLLRIMLREWTAR